MSARIASCQCGQLSAACEGDPVRISVCHCLDCQKRSGSSFAAQARFPVAKVAPTGADRVWHRTADSGARTEHHFCPTCGSEVWYLSHAMPETIAIPIGRFAEPSFPPPQLSVYEARKHSWVAIEAEGIDHVD